MTSPTPVRPSRLRSLTRLTAAATATATAAGLLVLGAPAPSLASSGPALLTPAIGVPDLSHAKRWRGHPGRVLVGYRVRRGDTATGLAVRFHAWTDELIALNRLGRNGRLDVGQRIRIPVVPAAVRRAHPHRTGKKQTRRRGRPWVHADASRAKVRRVVIRGARRHGVDRHLALAVSWQESGWQQRRISSAGAVGAMQIMPGTGRWMSMYADRRLNIHGLYDNVTAGTMLLRVLNGMTTKRRNAIAGYYQGLGSVRRRGMYPSTKRYLANVRALERRLERGWNPS